MWAAVVFILAQVLPRPAGALEFTLVEGGGKARVADYKGRVVALYFFSPD